MALTPARYFTRGRAAQKVQYIVIHWWGDPRTRPSFDGVVNWFKTGGGRNSAHFVIEGGRVTQMVELKNTAWHAGNWTANLRSVGLELNPRASDADYEQAAAVIMQLRAVYGDIPLRRHKDVSNKPTACPGTYDLARLDRLARRQALPPAKPVATTPPPASALQLGSSGAKVTALQRGLARMFPAYRHQHGRLRATGTFDATTRAWVIEFQRRTGLYPDGVVGPKTLPVLAKFGIRL